LPAAHAGISLYVAKLSPSTIDLRGIAARCLAVVPEDHAARPHLSPCLPRSLILRLASMLAARPETCCCIKADDQIQSSLGTASVPRRVDTHILELHMQLAYGKAGLAAPHKFPWQAQAVASLRSRT